MIGGSNSYEFISDFSMVYGKNLKFKEYLYSVFSGDINQDGFIDASDLSLIDNGVFNSLTGYVPTDITGDGIVDASDLSVVDNNVFKGISIMRP